MKIFKFSSDFHEALEVIFLLLVRKNYAETIVQMSRPDISPALYAKLLIYQPTSAFVQ